jgi:endonuclease V-like protein UPF0215 family
MAKKILTHTVGIDDAPFQRKRSGDVPIIGTVFAGLRLDGVLSGKVRKDGVNATRAIAAMVQSSRFYPQIQVVMLQGIALAGFNVVDIAALHETLQRPVVVVCRKAPDYAAIKNALLEKVPGGPKKWALIEAAGAMEKTGNVYVQRAGIDKSSVAALIKHTAVNSVIPEPLRTAHLIAGGIATGESRHRV